ncbi:hypothetical protein [Mycobacterium sp.]|uniref:hypothetical protein n=1 Tax=Mycobacterium sp. TaxID=1785 RepID=UPI002C7F32B0|nr:hypothetical protein [Mycobacterium sp.]HKP44940.1 hypothetical protein [Mycobacterium sp.]
MFADTDAVRAFGAANSAHAADLSAIASTLSSLPIGAVATIMGPVAARFVAALADAASRESHAVAALRDSVSAAGTTARSSAAGYEAADQRVGASLPRI